MASSNSSSKVLLLYRQLLLESKKFPDYNFREYALRRIRDTFRENRQESDPDKIAKLLEKAESNLNLIKRQVVINQMYKANPKIIESDKCKS
ncbi:LYR motif-containing protein bcn92 [Brevipalpus obovatus]|uniref:LYR motif-containing protein bcn92 n=1 Tax=Brevipalpus obovatus TaxID=246614 RepID=UPI003D9E0496